VADTALVTGAASGIGAALVGLLLDDGWGVLALDRAPIPARPGVRTLTCDLADPAQIVDVVARVRGEVSAIAHVAGVPGTAPAPAVLAVNVLAPRLLIEPLLGAVDAVVTVASVAQHRSPEPDDVLDELLACDDAADLDAWLARHPHDGAAAYDTSKKALVRWTRLTAGRHVGGTRLNSVSPGPVETPILGDFRTSMGEADIDRAAAAVGRHGRPEEVAAAIAFLLGPSASWVRGVDLPVEGGLLAARTAATVPTT
jgi:NAD(P)-dependent dehydrogenase (short-subunit alcohol dehydrogenase family)